MQDNECCGCRGVSFRLPALRVLHHSHQLCEAAAANSPNGGQTETGFHKVVGRGGASALRVPGALAWAGCLCRATTHKVVHSSSLSQQAPGEFSLTS